MKIVNVLLKLYKQGKILGKQDYACHVYHGDRVYLFDTPDWKENAKEVLYAPQYEDIMESETIAIVETDKWACAFSKKEFDLHNALRCITKLIEKYQD